MTSKKQILDLESLACWSLTAVGTLDWPPAELRVLMVPALLLFTQPREHVQQCLQRPAFGAACPCGRRAAWQPGREEHLQVSLLAGDQTSPRCLQVSGGALGPGRHARRSGGAIAPWLVPPGSLGC